VAGAAGTAIIADKRVSGYGRTRWPGGVQQDQLKRPFMTELFLVITLLDVTPGVSRRLHEAKKHMLNPAVRWDRWWEGNSMQSYTMMYDAEYKLSISWSSVGSDWSSAYVDGNAAYMAYLTSTNGVDWDKPSLGVTTLAGRRDHNVVFTSDMVSDTVSPEARKRFVQPSTPMVPQGKKAFFWSVVKHPHPSSPAEKFVALAIVQDHRRGAHIVTSPDGIHWSCAETPFWQTPHDVAGKGDDCLMQILYDHAKQKWVVYRRIIPEFSERMIAVESDVDMKRVERYYRSYAYAESRDLREWTNHRFILSMDPDDPPDTELYQFSCHKFSDIYVGYMSVFHLRPQSIDIQLATSRDGLHFTRVCRGEAFIPSGALGYYDYMAMACDQSEPIVVNGTVYIYYDGGNFRHDADMATSDPAILKEGAALATFKRDRFVSLETGESGSGLSRVMTKPFEVGQSKLYLNAATWMKGSIRVEALTPDWRPIPGFTESEALGVQGDALDHPVRWKNNADVSTLLGKKIRLKFSMTRARIYAMTLSNQDRKLNAVEGEYRHDKDGDSAPKLI